MRSASDSDKVLTPDQRGARGSHLGQRPLSIAGLGVHGGDAVFEHGNLEPCVQGVQHRSPHTVVSGQAGHEQPVHTMLAQPICQARAVERRVRLLLRVDALAEHLLYTRLVERRVEFGTRRAGLAVDGPRTSLGLIRTVVRRVPVTTGHNERHNACSTVNSRKHSVTPPNRKRASWAEVHLRVSDQQCIIFVGFLGHRGYYSPRGMDLSEPVLLTAGGLEKLKRDLERAQARRVEAFERMREAAQPGDIEDNPELEQAKEEVARLNERIYELEEMIGRAQIIEGKKSGIVEPGSTIEVEDDEGETIVYHLVGAVEADPTAGLISVESPVGRALVGKRAGDSVRVEVPAGTIELTVKTVS
jgi:transcription elongation factor GreA